MRGLDFTLGRARRDRRSRVTVALVRTLSGSALEACTKASAENSGSRGRRFVGVRVGKSMVGCIRGSQDGTELCSGTGRQARRGCRNIFDRGFAD
jgi:hypothetical protein